MENPFGIVIRLWTSGTGVRNWTGIDWDWNIGKILVGVVEMEAWKNRNFVSKRQQRAQLQSPDSSLGKEGHLLFTLLDVPNKESAINKYLFHNFTEEQNFVVPDLQNGGGEF